MSYPIVFETKIVRLSDGRLIHFDRSGCNNDDAGRNKNEFSAKIYTEDEFMQKIENFKANSKPYKESKDWELKIGSRYATTYDYGEHLLRMLKRAKSYKEFISSTYFRIEHPIGVQLYKPEEKFLSLKEFENEVGQLLNSCNCLRYKTIIEYPDVRDEQNLIYLIEKEKPVSFEIRNK